MILKQGLLNIIDQMKESAIRFPMVLLSALLVCGQAFFIIEFDQNSDLSSWVLLTTLSLGLPLFLSIDLLCETKKWQREWQRFGIILLGVVLLLTWYLTVGALYVPGYYLKYFQLSLIFHLFVAVAFHLKSLDENGFWQLNKHIFLGILTAFFYSSVLCVGIFIAMLTTDFLFDIDWDSDHYLHIFVFCFTLFQTWHFISGLPKNIHNLEEDQSYPKGLRLIVQSLLIPLTTLYLLILYAYMFKVILSWSWPSGYIGWLVTAVSVLGIFNLLLIEPEKKHIPWIRKYSRAYYIMIIPLLFMLLVAVGKRINQYGFTEKRYFLMTLASLLIGLSFYYIFSQSKKIKWIPVSLMFFAIVSLFGPLSAYNISLTSQMGRLETILAKNSLLSEGKALPVVNDDLTVSQDIKKEVSSDDETQISSILNYIIKNHGTAPLESLFPKKTLSKLYKQESVGYYIYNNRDASDIMQYLGLNYRSNKSYVKRAKEAFDLSLPSTHGQDFLNVDGYSYVANINQYRRGKNSGKINLGNAEYQVRIVNLSELQVLKDWKIIYNEDIGDHLRRWVALDKDIRLPSLTSEDLSIEIDNKNINAKIYFKTINGYLMTKDKLEVSRFSGSILLKAQ